MRQVRIAISYNIYYMIKKCKCMYLIRESARYK